MKSIVRLDGGIRMTIFLWGFNCMEKLIGLLATIAIDELMIVRIPF